MGSTAITRHTPFVPGKRQRANERDQCYADGVFVHNSLKTRMVVGTKRAATDMYEAVERDEKVASSPSWTWLSFCQGQSRRPVQVCSLSVGHRA